MKSNVIAFVGRPANSNYRPAPQQTESRDNVISLTSWVSRARPRRTPTGVYFTTRVLASQGQIA